MIVDYNKQTIQNSPGDLVRTRWKSILAIIGMASLSFSNGCFSTLMINRIQNDARAERDNPFFDDTIFALARPDAKTLSNPAFKDQVAFLGKTHCYVLTKGNRDLLDLPEGLRADHMSIDQGASELFSRPNLFWGKLVLQYSSPSAQELPALKAKGFIQDRAQPNRYLKAIDVGGNLGHPLDLPKNVASQLQHTYALRFRRPEPSRAAPVLKTAALLPLTITADIVTSPLQLVGIGILLFSGPLHY